MRCGERLRVGVASVLLGLWACGDSDAGGADSGGPAQDAGDHRHDAGPSGVNKLVIGEHCPYPEEPGPVPPRYSVRGGVEYWSPAAGCIGLTYQSDLDADLLQHLSAAADAFRAADCSRLCVRAPEPEDFDPAALDANLVDALDSLGRRVHFMFDRRALENAGLAEIYSDAESGQMLGAFVFLPRAPEDPLVVGDFLHLLGAALGLGFAADGVDSVMAPERPQSRDGLSELDRAALCELYGDDPLCD